MIVSVEPLLRRRAEGLLRLPQARLEILRGQAREKVRDIGGPVYLIGRSPHCDLTLGDPQFPDVHSYLFLTEQGVSLRRVAPTPEITIDGRSIQSGELFDGDRLRTGPYEFRLRVQEAWTSDLAAENWLAKLGPWSDPPPVDELAPARCGG
jgi:hypothetical protein